jgi:hypothetical protein
MQLCYKVLREDLTSLGLLGAPCLQYRFGEWNRPQEALSDHPRKGGGLWVAPTLGAARSMRKYMQRKDGVRTRIFRCRIDGVLYRTSCRVKTAGVLFTAEDEVT